MGAGKNGLFEDAIALGLTLQPQCVSVCVRVCVCVCARARMRASMHA